MLQKMKKIVLLWAPLFVLKSLNPPLCARINVREQMYNLTWESWR